MHAAATTAGQQRRTATTRLHGSTARPGSPGEIYCTRLAAQEKPPAEFGARRNGVMAKCSSPVRCHSAAKLAAKEPSSTLEATRRPSSQSKVPQVTTVTASPFPLTRCPNTRLRAHCIVPALRLIAPSDTACGTVWPRLLPAFPNHRNSPARKTYRDLYSARSARLGPCLILTLHLPPALHP